MERRRRSTKSPESRDHRSPRKSTERKSTERKSTERGGSIERKLDFREESEERKYRSRSKDRQMPKREYSEDRKSIEREKSTGRKSLERQMSRDGSEEKEIEESVVDRQLRQLNEERRRHLLRKMQISHRLESKTRELEFIKGLDVEDVIYMMHKKETNAARIIQRSWRVRKMRKIFSIETKEKIKKIKAATILQKAWRLRKRMKYLSHYQKSRKPRVDHFYDPIPNEKLKFYEDEIKTRLRTFDLSELGERTPEELEREYIAKYRNFYDNYTDNEMTRRKANWL